MKEGFLAPSLLQCSSRRGKCFEDHLAMQSHLHMLDPYSAAADSRSSCRLLLLHFIKEASNSSAKMKFSGGYV